jgi:hypothetical protein
VTYLRPCQHTQWSRGLGDNLRRWSLTFFHISLTGLCRNGSVAVLKGASRPSAGSSYNLGTD